MATQASASPATENGDAKPSGVSNGSTATQVLIVDLGKPQSRKKIKELRQGRGKLMPRVEAIVQDLVQAGAASPGSQPIVIVVREKTVSPWLLS